MNTYRTLLLWGKADISTWGLQNIHKTRNETVLIILYFNMLKVLIKAV